MSEYYHIVPWYNSEEWHQVYSKIHLLSSQNKQDALNFLLMWKARCPSLPSGIESTLTLLEVQVQDENTFSSAASDHLLRLAYSSAIMRFVNHMLDSETAKGSSLYRAAKTLGVPEWIIDLRHDIAHNNKTPSLELLRQAALTSLHWLLENYWDKHKNFVQDFISHNEKEMCQDDGISSLINLILSLSICAHSRSKIKTLSDIPDPEMKQAIVHEIKNLFKDQMAQHNINSMSIKALLSIINSKSKKCLQAKNVSSHVSKLLLNDDSMFMSVEVWEYIERKEFCKTSILSRRYLQCFEVLLTYLHSNDLIVEFVMSLIRSTQDHDSYHNKIHLAALWVSNILLALKRSQNFIYRTKKFKDEDIKGKSKVDLKSLFNHWFPADKEELILDLLKPVPKELTDIHYIQPIVSSYNPYIAYFVNDLLCLIEPRLPDMVEKRICYLAKLISNPSEFPIQLTSKIYTVEDLSTTEVNVVYNHEMSNQDSKSVEIGNQTIYDTQTNDVWHLASGNFRWSTCPIGQALQHQDENIKDFQ